MLIKDKISILMGIYNCASTLPEAIDSIIAQTYTNWELIMCDDCSTDNTYEIAEEYRKKYPDKIKLIKNEKNSKLAFTLNHCLEEADGEYIARMDGDDISIRDRFEKQINYLKTHPDIQLVGSSMQQFNEVDGNIAIVSKPEHTDKDTLKTSIPFNHATIMTYHYVYDELGGYTVSKRTERGQDYDLWFRFFAKGYIGDNRSEPLYLVREDMNAIKRRTFRVRWSVFRTTIFGYRLLGYPKKLLLKEFVITLTKSLTPSKFQYWYRKLQQRKTENNKNSCN